MRLAKRHVRTAGLPKPYFPDPTPKGTIVNKLNFNVIALAVGLAFSAGAMAQNLSQSD